MTSIESDAQRNLRHDDTTSEETAGRTPELPPGDETPHQGTESDTESGIESGADSGAEPGVESGGESKKDIELLASDDVERYENEWRAVQAGFVDDPEGAVREADALIDRVVETLTSKITQRQAALTDRLNGDGSQTEQLRLALREYRSLFSELVPGAQVELRGQNRSTATGAGGAADGR
ncbi:MAG TPA: hypothetical protein VJT49_11245 [Amycolatopsis sp.]|uniref:hypothetical protein n=1 Tax=Amycolatopsis sp. TaxID=37632 RepID=UPI002B49FC8E|nr:hypothetical protein [Amycolatopsis sp.]HKS45665.1 hypothetical protein [Amycolatopsis sp.]